LLQKHKKLPADAEKTKKTFGVLKVFSNFAPSKERKNNQLSTYHGNKGTHFDGMQPDAHERGALIDDDG
jgi:hypothetical protein